MTHVQPWPGLNQLGANGVIDMGFLKVIRTWALRGKMPIREIARRTGISRNTIKKYLRQGKLACQAWFSAWIPHPAML